MKKIILLILLFSAVFHLSAQDLDGRYELTPYLIRLADGRLIHPDKPYAYQYTGIEGIQFLRGSFARIFTVDEEFDAFYKIIPGDSDNVIIDFSLRSGASFRLELVREEGDVFRYHYRLKDPPFEEFRMQEELPEESAEEDTPVKVEEPKQEMPVVEKEISSEVEEPAEGGIGVYIGIMKKQTEE